MRALLSVWDKTGLVDFARELGTLGFELISTGGTLRALDDAGIPVTPVAEVTGFPEILDGRVKTLHPKIHGGILADRNKSSHADWLSEHEIGAIDLVVVNLYPFRETVATGSSPSEIIEMIDIGGPTMVRAAAKNHAHVTVVIDPEDYSRVLEALGEGSAETIGALRAHLAAKAFEHSWAYDRAIAEWLTRDRPADESSDEPSDETDWPKEMTLELQREFEPRYGENPHQAAAVYLTADGDGLLGGFEQLQGKQLSFNNLLDADAARRLVARFGRPVVAIIKHNNPCGVGICDSEADSPAEAYKRALACDPVSAFGSIVALNRPADGVLAEAMATLFVEVVLAPSYEPEALEIFSRKKNLRVLTTGPASPRDFELRAIDGGFLAQTPDTEPDQPSEWTCVTERQPTDTEQAALDLAWKVATEVRSNAIVVANHRQTVGIGAGQMSRVDSCRIAIDKAELPLAGTVAASDAFFPFADGLETLAEAGVTAIVQPGGSKRDQEVIDAANGRDVAMMMTGRRHFKH